MGQLIDTRTASTPKGFEPNVDNKPKKAQASTILKIVWYLLWILIIPIIIHISLRNNLFRKQTQVNELASGIDVQLKKRRDTLLKLLEQAKKYIKHEKEIFFGVTKLRKINVNPDTREKVNAQTNSIFGRLLAIAENYPDLKSDKIITNLMDQTTYLENEIGAARRLYNSSVQSFNQELFMWPSSVVATTMFLSTLPYFVASTKDKQDVEMNFD